MTDYNISSGPPLHHSPPQVASHCNHPTTVKFQTPIVGGISFIISRKSTLRLLRLRLQPLTSVRRNFEEYFGSVLEPDQVGTTESSWSAAGLQKNRMSEESIQDLHHATQAPHCYGSDVKQLWEDVVQQLLKGVRPPPEHPEL